MQNNNSSAAGKSPSPDPVIITEPVSGARAPSRQSSVGSSYSDVAPSRANTDTSDLMSDEEDDDEELDMSD